ncbi:MAG: hypothetical protein EBQ96_01235 [Proteobacteria bacterium]|nr:hypothetical protein [Pseudomonadota bacterium]
MNAPVVSKPIDKYIPWLFVVFFLVIAAVDTVFVTMAVRTHTGVVTDQAYEKGLAYNKTLEDSAAQSALGWTGEVKLTRDLLTYDLRDQKGNAIEGATLKASIKRPVTQGYDLDIDLKSTGPGAYQAPLSLPLKGQWQVRIYAKVRDQEFQTNAFLLVP